MFRITKLFTSGPLQGIILTDTSPVYMPAGPVVPCVGSPYRVLACLPVVPWAHLLVIEDVQGLHVERGTMCQTQFEAMLKRDRLRALEAVHWTTKDDGTVWVQRL